MGYTEEAESTAEGRDNLDNLYNLFTAKAVPVFNLSRSYNA